MDIIDFVEALKRQKWFLITGIIALLLFVVAVNYRVEDLSFAPRTEPKYTATIQMAVVPEGVTSLADPAASGNYESAANFYATLLGSPQAAFDIATSQGVQFTDAMGVSVLSRTGIMSVTTTAADPDGAERAALGSFRWLEARLSDEPVIAALPDTADAGEEEIENVANVVMAVDPLYAGVDTDLFVAVETRDDPGFRLPLADAAISERSYPLILSPGNGVTVTMETGDGTEIGSTFVDVADLSGVDGNRPPLLVTIEDGAVTFGEDTELSFVPNRVDVRWDLNALGEEEETGQYSIMLLSETPIIGETGLRRVPILVGAPIIAGILVLLAAATVIDRYRQLRKAHHQEAELDAELAELRAQGTDDQYDDRITREAARG